MIACAMPFLNELDLLELKCRELSPVVDLFVVVESPLTFTGIPKPLVFQENKARFAEWSFHHVITDPPKVTPSPWEREEAQRNVIYETIAKLNPEIAIYCDVDECPRAESVAFYADKCDGIRTFEMDQLLFYFDRLDTSIRWTNVKVWRPRNLRAEDGWPWRGTACPVIHDAGWHFEYFGKRETLLEKLAAFSHAPEPGVANFRRGLDEGRLPGIERTAPYAFEKLPRFVRENRARFADQFAPETGGQGRQVIECPHPTSDPSPLRKKPTS